MGEGAELTELVEGEGKDADVVGSEVGEELGWGDGGGSRAVEFAFGGDMVCSVS